MSPPRPAAENRIGTRPAGPATVQASDLWGRSRHYGRDLLKGGDPAARSRTATLLRLHPSHWPHRGKRPPEG